MKEIVAFYSKSGNCKALARALSNRFGCDILELTEVKKKKRRVHWLHELWTRGFFQ